MKPKFEPQKPFDDTQDRHHRRSIRLPGYDYSQAGAYYVTIVTHHRDPLFGGIRDGKMHLNDLGMTADECWRAIPEHFPFVELGAYVVMPNHMRRADLHGHPKESRTGAFPCKGYGIVVIRADDESSARRGTIYRAPTIHTPTMRAPTEKFGKPVKGSLPTIIRTYKAAVTRRIGRELNATGIWQRNYYEHIIRDEEDLQRITDYIEMNPSRWDEDDENPRNTS